MAPPILPRLALRILASRGSDHFLGWHGTIGHLRIPWSCWQCRPALRHGFAAKSLQAFHLMARRRRVHTLGLALLGQMMIHWPSDRRLVTCLTSLRPTIRKMASREE